MYHPSKLKSYTTAWSLIASAVYKQSNKIFKTALFHPKVKMAKMETEFERHLEATLNVVMNKDRFK